MKVDPDAINKWLEISSVNWYSNEYTEALCHFCAGVMLACSPTHTTPLGVPITDILWPVRIQWDALHIYEMMPGVLETYYNIPCLIERAGHTAYAGEGQQHRVYFRVLNNKNWDKYKKAYLIPDMRGLWIDPDIKTV